MNIDTNVFSNTLNFNLLQNVEFASTILFLLTVSVMILKQSTLLPGMEVTQVRRSENQAKGMPKIEDIRIRIAVLI
jgi:hypothetical protein